MVHTLRLADWDALGVPDSPARGKIDECLSPLVSNIRTARYSPA